MRLTHLLAVVCLTLLATAAVATAKITEDSGNLDAGATFQNTFAQAGTWEYMCKYHLPTMTGKIVVQEGAPTDAVSIGMTSDPAFFFVYGDQKEQGLTVTVGPGTTVTWTNDDANSVPHTVTESKADFPAEKADKEGSAIGVVAVLVVGLALLAARRRA